MNAAVSYREEQRRLLRRSVLGRVAALVLVWTLVFAALAAFANAFVVPRIADIVADRVAPWVSVPAEDNQAIAASWYTEAALQTKEQIAAEYVLRVAASAGNESADLGPSEEVKTFVQDIIPVIVRSNEIPASSLLSGVQDSSVSSDAEGGESAENAAVNGGDSTGASDSLASAWILKADSVIEAVDRLNQENPAAFTRLYDEAMAVSGLVEEALVVYPPEYNPNEVYYLDGHMEYRDLSTYGAIRSLKIPLAVGCYALGVAVAIWLGLRRALAAFDQLFGAMESVIMKRAEEPRLSRELLPTAMALSEMRRESEANERAAKAAEQRKDELVAYLAHDIRTPLTSIVGYLTMLEESPDMPASQRSRYAGIALSRAYRLEGMMEEFFEITRYNLQSIPIERSRFDAGILCQQVADEFFPSAEARGISIEVEASQPLEAFADASKVSRVLNNLLKNAVSYADENSEVRVRAHIANEGPEATAGIVGVGAGWGEGGAGNDAGAAALKTAQAGAAASSVPRAETVESDGAQAKTAALGAAQAGGSLPLSPNAEGALCAKPKEEVAALGRTGGLRTFASARDLVIEVENQGREISPVHLQSIFEKFYREDASRATDKGGSGLGLAIAREIARAHGGELSAESASGRTVFTLRIPV